MATARPRRSDAQRNRDAILAAARDAFDAEGVLASLDGIAVRAGVGNATLYRHFPTRDDLLAAVLETSVGESLAVAGELTRTRTPRDALSGWLGHLAWQLRIWHNLPYCIATARADSDSPMTYASNPLHQQTAALLAAAQASGGAADGVTADELFELVTTLSWGIDRYGDDEDTARRRVAMATAGVFTDAG